MQNLIIACVGLAIAIAGVFYLARLLYLKKYGVPAKAEVVNVKEVLKRKGGLFGYLIVVTKKTLSHYTHTLKYELDGRSYEADDRADYTQPMKIGSTHIILCDPKNPESFKFEADVQKHITIAAALVAMALLFAGRFFYAYIK